jgi:hypothetical protein
MRPVTRPVESPPIPEDAVAVLVLEIVVALTRHQRPGLRSGPLPVFATVLGERVRHPAPTTPLLGVVSALLTPVVPVHVPS